MGEIIIDAPHKRAAMLKHPEAYRIVSRGDRWAVFYSKEAYFEYVKKVTAPRTQTDKFGWYE